MIRESSVCFRVRLAAPTDDTVAGSRCYFGLDPLTPQPSTAKTPALNPGGLFRAPAGMALRFYRFDVRHSTLVFRPCGVLGVSFLTGGLIIMPLDVASLVVEPRIIIPGATGCDFYVEGASFAGIEGLEITAWAHMSETVGSFAEMGR